MISAVACLQLLLRLKDHDVLMLFDSKLRWTTNGSSMYSYIRRDRAALCTALEASVRNPEAAADKAIQAVLSVVPS